MNTDIRIFDTDLAQALRAYVERRLHFSLSRFGKRVGRVSVRITDLNDLRGGVDKACRVSAEFLPSGKILVQRAVDANLYAAISRATQGIGRAFAKALARKQERQRNRNTIRFPIQDQSLYS